MSSLILMTTRENIESATPLEKFEILADDIDRLRNGLAESENQRTVDELLETVDLEKLANQYEISITSLRRKLLAAGAEVFKIGKRSVIRKIKLLAVFEKLEQL